MTSYIPIHRVYEDCLLKLLDERPTEAECETRIKMIQDHAAVLETEMKQPDWRPPIVSFIPHYGDEAEIQALRDFNQLRPMLTTNSFFARFLHGKTN